MRAKEYETLGKLITGANNWRSAAATAGVDLDRLVARFPSGELITLNWVQETKETTDPNTGAAVVTVVWEGWNIETDPAR